MNSTTKSIRKASKYDSSGGGGGGDDNIDNATSSGGNSNNNGIVDSLKKKEAVATAMCLSCMKDDKVEPDDKVDPGDKDAGKSKRAGVLRKDAHFLLIPTCLTPFLVSWVRILLPLREQDP